MTIRFHLKAHVILLYNMVWSAKYAALRGQKEGVT